MLHLRISIIALIGLVSCQPTEPFVVERPVILRPFERLDSTGRNLDLRVATEKIYPCINFFMASQLRREGTGWQLWLGDVPQNETDICLTALGPARTGQTLGAVTEGTYPFSVDNLGSVATGQIRVTASQISIDLPETAGVRVEPARLGRVPAGTIWGVIGYDTPQQEAAVQAFFAALEGAGAQAIRLPEGDYSYFSTDASGQLKPWEPSGYRFARGFLFRYTGDAQTLRRIVGQAYRDNNGKVHPNLRTDRGQEFFGFSS